MEKDNYLDKLKEKYFNKKYFVWIFIIIPDAAAIIWGYREQVYPLIRDIVEPIIYKISPPSFESDNANFKILILPFERTENEKLSKFESFLEKRFKDLKSNDKLDIDVIYDKNSDLPISFEEAKIIGKTRNADLVLFGSFYNEDKPKNFSSEMKWVLIKSFENIFGDSSYVLKEFANFGEISKGKITQEQEYVTNWVLALKHYSVNDFKKSMSSMNFLENNYQYITKTDNIYNTFKGNLFFIFGDLDSAKVRYTNSLKINFSSPENHHGLGLVNQNQGHKLNSLRHYLLSLILGPENWVCHSNLAGMYSEDDKMLNFSYFHYTKAIELNPQYAIAHYNYANLFRRLKMYDSALVHYRTVIKIDSNYSNAYMNIGITLANSGKYDSIYYFLIKAKDVGPNNYGAYYSLGYFHQQISKNIDSSIYYYKKSIQVNPKYVDSYHNLGVVFVASRHDPITALKYFYQAVSIDTAKFQSYWSIALIHKDNKHLDSARYYYNKACKLNPSLSSIENDKLFLEKRK